MPAQSTNRLVSPLLGEIPPHQSPEALETAFKATLDNRVRVPGGDVLRVAPRRGEPIRQLPFLPEHGMFINFHPQNIELSQATADTLEALMRQWFSHYPIEPTLARTRYNTPMLITRADFTLDPTSGELGLCEFDDVPTALNLLQTVNPVAGSYIQAVAAALDRPLYSAFLPEAGYTYPHDEGLWLPTANGHDPSTLAVIPRGRRLAPGFAKFIEVWGPSSIVAGAERDNKGPLVAMKLGVLAANSAVALQAGGNLMAEQPVVLKGLRSSRTEAAGVLATGRHKIRGASSVGQLTRKLEAAGIDPTANEPIVMQPFHRPPTMAELGLTFDPRDQTTLASFGTHSRHSTESDLAKPGNEAKYHVLCRVYGVVIPGLGPKIIGGFWLARPNAAIIHGASDSLSGTITIQGLKEYRRG